MEILPEDPGVKPRSNSEAAKRQICSRKTDSFMGFGFPFAGTAGLLVALPFHPWQALINNVDI
jgi:hypothetical protein